MLRPRAPFLATVVGTIVAVALERPLRAAFKAIFDMTVQDYWKDTAVPFFQAHAGPWGATMLEWISPFQAGALTTLLIVFACELAFAWWRGRHKRQAITLDLSKTVYENIEIDLRHLLSQLSTPNAMQAVDKKLFVGCKFVGPGCMVIDGDSTFMGNFGLDTVGHPLDLRAKDAIVGAPLFSNCTFQDVTFSKVQLIVPQKSYREIYRLFSEHIPRFEQHGP